MIVLIVSTANSFAQLKITKIKDKEQEHFIVNAIGYPILGQYNYINKAEPITILNVDGTGIMQDEDLKKENIIWGIECTESGIPIFKEGFDSSAYSLWYRVTGNAKGKTKDGENWISKSFTIHFKKRKMFIDGDRVREYVED